MTSVAARSESNRSLRWAVEQRMVEHWQFLEACDLAATTGSTPPPPASGPLASPDAPVRGRLSHFWSGLVEGDLAVADHFSAMGRYCVVATRCVDTSGRGLGAGERELVQRALVGEAQKVLALDSGASLTSISVLLSGAVHRLGLDCRLRAIPLPLVLCALDYLGVVEPGGGQMVTLALAGMQCVVASVPRLECHVLPELSETEYRIATLVAEGMNYSEIADLRGTSKRTTANQIRSVFSKLGVQGRFELIRSWAMLQWATKDAPATRRNSEIVL